MEDKSIVIFLDYFKDIKKAASYVRRLCRKTNNKYIAVTSNFYVGELSGISNLEVVYDDDLLSGQDYEFMDRYAFNLAQTWHLWLKPAEGITEYRGIQFGAVAEERAQRFFVYAVKRLQITLKMIERFHPAGIVFIGEKEVFRGLAECIKEELKIATLFIECTEDSLSVRKISKNLYGSLAEMISMLCDNIMRLLMVRGRKHGGIFIDTYLYSEYSELKKKYPIYPYLIGKGLRVRSAIIKKQRSLYAPIFMESFFAMHNFLCPFRGYWKFISADSEFRNRFNYKGLPAWKALEGFIGELIMRDFKCAQKNILFLQKLYKNLRPKEVILRDDSRSATRAMVFTAKLEGVPTLIIQHGILTETLIVKHGALTNRHVFTQLYADKVAVWGKADMEWYRKYGNDATRCVVTGKAQHDAIYPKKEYYEKEGKMILAEIGADVSRETVLNIATIFENFKHAYSTYYYRDSEYVILNAILKAIHLFPEKQFVIKMHPFDLVDPENLINKFNLSKYPNIFIVKHVDILPLIKISSIVITSACSSATLDALIFEKPVISLNFSKAQDMIPFAARGAALRAVNSEEIYQAINKISKDENVRNRLASNRGNFTFDYAYKIDGKAKERIINLIEALYNKSNFSDAIDMRHQKPDLDQNGVKDGYLIGKK